MVRWLKWHCPPDTGFEIRALAVWGRVRYLSVTEAPHNTNFHTWMGKKQFCFFQTAETGNRTPNRTPDSGVKGSGANHYPRAPALKWMNTILKDLLGQIIHNRYFLWKLNTFACTETDKRQFRLSICLLAHILLTWKTIIKVEWHFRLA